MHYHKSKFLRFANAAFEFLLLILTFILAGWLRSYTPMGSQLFGRFCPFRPCMRW